LKDSERRDSIPEEEIDQHQHYSQSNVMKPIFETENGKSTN
jgi:hypothetical protein